MRHLIAAVLFASSVLAMEVPVSQLPARCTYNPGNVTCPKTYDSTSGVCRTIRFSTSSGEIQVLVCDKGDRYELYRQSFPQGLDFQACTGTGCVDEVAGFAAFTDPGTTGPPPADPPVTGSLVPPDSAGFAGQTRAGNHAMLLDAWWGTRYPEVIQSFTCLGGECAWVPWYQTTTRCGVADLRGGTGCPISGGVDYSRNCMVTDEFSQVMLATAQGTDVERMRQLVRTLQAIDGKWGGLPAWKVMRTVDTLQVADSNSASDADARIILALYVAAASTHFPQADRDALRARANALANDFLTYDFRYECRTGRNGVPICYWLSSGGNQVTGGLGSNNFAHAGYFGDAVIALLAAHKATGQARYLDAARDTVNAFLTAANFNGSSFSVPPFAFRWDTNATPLRAVCTEQCDGQQWDYDDAPRAVSICKARYYASLAQVTLPADLTTYCSAWMNTGGVTATAYQHRYRYDGTLVGPPTGGWHENGLGAALNFSNNTGDLATRLSYVGSQHYDPNGPGIWYSEDCHGVYRNAFYTTNLGSAIGRDMRAFQ